MSDYNIKLGAAIQKLQNYDAAKLIITGGMKINKKNCQLLQARNFTTVYWYTDSSDRFKGVEEQQQLFDQMIQ